VDSEKIPSGSEEFPKRVLIVDDEPLIRWATSSTLTDAGFSVIEAATAAGARQQFAATRFDLAVLDLRLPDGDGVTLMNELHERYPDCRFIVMTAFRTPELTAQTVTRHVPVLDKPFGMPDLVGLVGEVMNANG
jgi:DNA-binding NtrC family response regulator